MFFGRVPCGNVDDVLLLLLLLLRLLLLLLLVLFFLVDGRVRARQKRGTSSGRGSCGGDPKLFGRDTARDQMSNGTVFRITNVQRLIVAQHQSRRGMKFGRGGVAIDVPVGHLAQRPCSRTGHEIAFGSHCAAVVAVVVVTAIAPAAAAPTTTAATTAATAGSTRDQLTAQHHRRFHINGDDRNTMVVGDGHDFRGAVSVQHFNVGGVVQPKGAQGFLCTMGRVDVGFLQRGRVKQIALFGGMKKTQTMVATVANNDDARRFAQHQTFGLTEQTFQRQTILQTTFKAVFPARDRRDGHGSTQ